MERVPREEEKGEEELLRNSGSLYSRRSEETPNLSVIGKTFLFYPEFMQESKSAILICITIKQVARQGIIIILLRSACMPGTLFCIVTY